MKRKNNIIMKCCVCERVKTDYGWNYQFLALDEDNVVSHGYCPLCYRNALHEIENLSLDGFEAAQPLELVR